MESAIVLFERSLTVPKERWRDPAFDRTLHPLDIADLIRGAWHPNRTATARRGGIVIPLHPDGSPQSPPLLRPIQGQQSWFAGVFEFTYRTADSITVELREEECTRRLGNPARPSRRIAILDPWNPVRILLNGRTSSYSGQHYILRDYYATLCSDPVPDSLGPLKHVDLQENLF